MSLTEELKDGMEFDLKKALSKEQWDILSLLTDTNGKVKNNAFIYHEHNDYYFHGDDAIFESMKVNKYDYSGKNRYIERKQFYRREYRSVTEYDYDDCEDASYVIGAQIAHIDEKDKLFIRIVPFAFSIDAVISLKVNNYAYYVTYNKLGHNLVISYNDAFDIERMGDEWKQELQGFIYEEYDDYIDDNFIFSYSYPLTEIAIKELYQLIGEYVSYIKNAEPNENIIKELFNLKKYIKYPIYVNEDTQRIKDLKDYSPEELQKEGFFPEKAKVEECFGIHIPLEGTIVVKDIHMVCDWQMLVKKHEIEKLLDYYSDVEGINIGIKEIALLLRLYKETDAALEQLVRFVFRGAVKEKMQLKDVLYNVLKIKEDIVTWNGRYSEKLLERHKKRESSWMDKKDLDKMERKPTLDNFYKIMCCST